MPGLFSFIFLSEIAIFLEYSINGFMEYSINIFAFNEDEHALHRRIRVAANVI